MGRALLVAALLSAAIYAPAQDDSGLLGTLARPLKGRSMRASSTFREGKDGKYDPKAKPLGSDDPKSNWDNFTVPPGGRQVLMDERGPGMITHLWMTFLGPEAQDWAKRGSATHQDMLLRITWDGSPSPGVEAPVGDFFASCFGKRSEVVSLPVVVSNGSAYNCYWRMPFRKSARIEIVNQGTKPISLLYYNVDWIKLDSLPSDTPYFYAHYRQEYPARHGLDYVVLDTKGHGHYVGTVLAIRARSPMWPGEGDEKIYIDGEADASVWGTGTEDYFSMAWGLRRTNGPYSGAPYVEAVGTVGGEMSAYRWHLNDPIVFDKGIRVTFEHYGWISPDESRDGKVSGWTEREDDYSSVAFWYQTGQPSPQDPVPTAAERLLPSIDRVVAYARDTATHGDGEAHPQTLDFYEGAQLLYMPKQQAGAWLEIPLTVSRSEPLRLVLNMTTSYDFGIYQTYLDGVKIGDPMDLYSREIENHEFPLLDFWPETGPHVLRLECVGRNPASQGVYLGIESARLRERRPRVGAYARDKGKDWKTNPVLYGG